jgi:HSP20 family protein
MSALVRYTRPASLSTLIDEFFDNGFFSLLDRDITHTSWPRVDITEDKDVYRLKADLPGMSKDDISVNVENGVLSINGEKKEEKKEHEKDRYYHYERSYGRFSRCFNLPDDVDAAKIEASYSNGVLELTLKKDEKAKPKAIEVKVK